MAYVALRYFSIFCSLVRTNLIVVRQQLIGKVINLYIWVFCSLVVMGYVMQAFGLTSDFGAFQLATVIGTVGLFEVYGNAARTIMDFEGDRSISYYLTLPVRPAVVLLSAVCSYALVGILLSLAVLPFGALILYSSFSLLNVAWVKFAIILFLSNIFYALFTLAVTGHVGSMSNMENIWSRFIFPMWFMGGFQFSWGSIYDLSVPFAYALLCNPIIFIMEGSRAALLGSADCIPWSVCCIALIFFSGIFWMYAHYKMKKLLDFV